MKFFKIAALWVFALLATVLLFVSSVLMGPEWLFSAFVYSFIGAIIFLIMRSLEALLARFYPSAANSALTSAFAAVCGYSAAYLYIWFDSGKTDFKFVGGMIVGTIVCFYLLRLSSKILNRSAVPETPVVN